MNYHVRWSPTAEHWICRFRWRRSGILDKGEGSYKCFSLNSADAGSVIERASRRFSQTTGLAMAARNEIACLTARKTTITELFLCRR